MDKQIGDGRTPKSSENCDHRLKSHVVHLMAPFAMDDTLQTPTDVVKGTSL